MAARHNPKIDQAHRDRIQTTQLIKRLQNFALLPGNARAKHRDQMTGTQVRAAIALLHKTVPDVQSVEHIGNVTHSHEQVLAQLDEPKVIEGEFSKPATAKEQAQAYLEQAPAEPDKPLRGGAASKARRQRLWEEPSVPRTVMSKYQRAKARKEASSE